MPYLTPDDAPGLVFRALVIPAPLLHVITGTLLYPTDPVVWEAFGDMTPDDAAAAAQAVFDSYTRGSMLGLILPYASADCPDYMLPCDGATYDRVDYPELYGVIDPIYVIDADQFTVPDLTDRFPLCAGTNDPGDVGGAATHTLTLDEIPGHVHDYQFPSGVPGLAGAEPVTVVTGAVTDQTGSAGGDQAHNNMPPYLVVKYGIVAR